MNMFVAAGPAHAGTLPCRVTFRACCMTLGCVRRPQSQLLVIWTEFYSGGHAGYATARFDCSPTKLATALGKSCPSLYHVDSVLGDAR
jgi:hypothetical protein